MQQKPVNKNQNVKNLEAEIFRYPPFKPEPFPAWIFNKALNIWVSLNNKSRKWIFKIAIGLKIVNYKKFDAVPQLAPGQEQSESLRWPFKIMIIQAVSKPWLISVNTYWIHVLYLIVLLCWNLICFNKNVNYPVILLLHKLNTYLRTLQSYVWVQIIKIRTNGSLTLKIRGSYIRVLSYSWVVLISNIKKVEIRNNTNRFCGFGISELHSSFCKSFYY